MTNPVPRPGGPRLLALLLTLVAAPVAAQDHALPSSPRFMEIVQLAQDGRADSARTTIGGILMALGGLIVMWPQSERKRQGGYVTELTPQHRETAGV